MLLMAVINNSVMARFKGFSTVDRIRAPFTLTDRELVKRDLLNEFYTRKGERVMQPNFGSVIWDLLMEPEDNLLESEIRADIQRVVARDPRVELVNIILYTLDHSVSAEVVLRFLPFDVVENLYLLFERNSIEGVE
jgi:phage baseplate assembly protein W